MQFFTKKFYLYLFLFSTFLIILFLFFNNFTNIFLKNEKINTFYAEKNNVILVKNNLFDEDTKQGGGGSLKALPSGSSPFGGRGLGLGGVVVGAENLEKYLPLLKNKKIALVVNHTALVGKTHLVDTLLSYSVDIIKIFVPEHGFRGEADAGEKVANTIDQKTKIPLISLYGKQKKPTKKQLEDVDLVIFDIQDVGARFYTYISTLHYIMEACAENNKNLLVLDRPNPRGDEIMGNIRKKSSFVALHPIPIIHGLTVGELAQMINGEKWLGKNLICNLQVIKNENYTHQSQYVLPVRPSPNLPNQLVIMLYPSLCFFEGTNVSVGRGTDTPFEVIGVPFEWGKEVKGEYKISFMPIEKFGAKNPMHKGKTCFGINISNNFLIDKMDKDPRIKPMNKNRYFKIPFSLEYLLEFYKKCPQKDKKIFFNKFFDTLVGDTLLRTQIVKGFSEKQIKKSWEKELEKYKIMRKKYLLYE